MWETGAPQRLPRRGPSGQDGISLLLPLWLCCNDQAMEPMEVPCGSLPLPAHVLEPALDPPACCGCPACPRSIEMGLWWGLPCRAGLGCVGRSSTDGNCMACVHIRVCHDVNVWAGLSGVRWAPWAGSEAG